MGNTKRRKFLVNKGFQYRYILLMTVPLILLLTVLYFLIYYAVFTEMLIPEAVATTLVPAMKKVNMAIAVVVPIALLALIKTALVHSNNLVGPIPRLEKEIDRAIGGDFSVRIKTRNRDELNAFVSKINRLLEKVDKAREEKS